MQLRTPGALQLTHLRPECRERRFYRLEIVTDLFGTILLRRCWGRIGTDGRQSSQAFAEDPAAFAAFRRQTARKRRRGYKWGHLAGVLRRCRQ
jgi:predicted DNA-binding WGR domain protein